MNNDVLRIAVSDVGDTRMLKLTGDLDSFTTERLVKVSNTWIPGSKRLLVNLDDLEYIDSAGLSALVGVWVKAKDNGVAMVISCQNARVHRVLEITGLLNFFTIEGQTPEMQVVPGMSYGTGKGTSAEKGVQSPKPPSPGGLR